MQQELMKLLNKKGEITVKQAMKETGRCKTTISRQLYQLWRFKMIERINETPPYVYRLSKRK